MYTVTHLDKYATKPPYPEPVPRPGEAAEPASTASAYAGLEHVPAIPLEQLGDWLAT